MEQNSVLPDHAIRKSVFVALCAYLILLLSCAFLALLTDDTVLSAFIGLDEFYLSVVLLESVFGVFFLPFITNRSTGLASQVQPAGSGAQRSGRLSSSHILSADGVVVFSSGAPFVVLAAFAARISWHAVFLTQLLVFSTWFVALSAKRYLEKRDLAAHNLRGRLALSHIYLPLAAVLFFGLAVAGRLLSGFSGAAGDLSAFSVPGVLVSWCTGRYFGFNGWLGIFACLGAFTLWSRKFMTRHWHQVDG